VSNVHLQSYSFLLIEFLGYWLFTKYKHFMVMKEMLQMYFYLSAVWECVMVFNTSFN